MATFAKLNVALTSTASGFLTGMKSAMAATTKLGRTSKSVATNLARSFAKIKFRIMEIVSPIARLGKGLLRLLNPLRSLVGGFGLLGTIFAGVRLLGRIESFNQAMTRSTAIMGKLSKDTLGAMQAAAIEVGKTTQFSAREAAEAYFFLASAGLKAKESIIALSKVAQFAQAGNFDLARATELLVDSQKAMGLGSDNVVKNLENMVKVSDILVKANTLSNASIEKFAMALTSNAGVSARLAGQSIEETVAVLAAFAAQGIKAEEAGTKLGIVLRDMRNKAVINAAAFNKWGIRVFGAFNKIRPLTRILKDFDKSILKLNPKMQTAALLQLGFSLKSQAALNAVLGLTDKIKEYKTALDAAGGATKDIAEKSLTSFQKAFFALRGTIDQTLIILGPHIFGPITEGIKRFTAVLPETIGKVLNFLDEARLGALKFTHAFLEGLNMIISGIEDFTIAFLKGIDLIANGILDIVQFFGMATGKTFSVKGNIQNVEAIGEMLRNGILKPILGIEKELEASKHIDRWGNRVKAKILESMTTLEKFRLSFEQIKQSMGGALGRVGPFDLDLKFDTGNLKKAGKLLLPALPFGQFISGMQDLAKGVLLKGGKIKIPKDLPVKIPELVNLKDMDDKIQRAIFKSQAAKEQEILDQERNRLLISLNIGVNNIAKNALVFE